MAAALALSTNTVRGHVRTLQRKLTAPGRRGIVGGARELGRHSRRADGAEPLGLPAVTRMRWTRAVSFSRS
jgi:hypothetical protein